MRGIVFTHLCWQRNKRSAIVYCVYSAKLCSRKRKNVADKYIDIPRTVARQFLHPGNLRFEAKFTKQLGYGKFTQFSAGNPVTIRKQPAEIARLATQWQEDTTAACEI